MADYGTQVRKGIRKALKIREPNSVEVRASDLTPHSALHGHERLDDMTDDTDTPAPASPEPKDPEYAAAKAAQMKLGGKRLR